jgi:hypothetical protein
MLGDLMIAKWLDVDDYGRLVVTAPRHLRLEGSPEFFGNAVGAVRHDLPAPVRDWLRFFSLTLPGEVAAHLAEYQVVQAVTERRFLWLKATTVYRPADISVAFSQLLHVSNLFDRPRPLDEREILLAGLVHACGLGPIAWGRTPEQLVAWVRSLLGGLRELIRQTEALVADRVATQI